MNRMVRTAMIMAGVGTLLSFAGCGSQESEYKSLLDKAVKLEMIDRNTAKQNLEEFKAMTPEKRQEAIKQAKIWTAAAEAAK